VSIRSQTDEAREQTTPKLSGRGLCMACRRDPTCSYPRTRPVLQCEEFEGYGPRARDYGSSGESGDPRDPWHAPTAEYKGLCTSCANRDTCAFPKPAGGIWHCEEFR
jgi:hypothetical protein